MYTQGLPCFLHCSVIFCMSVHDDKGHDEEANIHQDDHQHGYNECPHKVSVWIQPASAEEQRELDTG